MPLPRSFVGAACASHDDGAIFCFIGLRKWLVKNVSTFRLLGWVILSFEFAEELWSMFTVVTLKKLLNDRLRTHEEPTLQREVSANSTWDERL